MKALILSGGKGTRLRPITHTSAKQLVPIANKPILFYAIESVVRAGVTDIGMIVGDTAGEVRAAVGDGSRFGARVNYIPQSAPLGLAHAVKEAQGYLGHDPFVMYLGDNLVPSGIAPFVERFRAGQPDALILLARVPAPERFGVAELRDGQVVRLEEKPKTPRSDLALVGVYLFTPRIFEAVAAIRPSARGELEITDAIQWLIDHGARVEPHLVEGWWKDTGRLEDLLEANRIVLDELVPCVKGTVTSDSQVTGKVVIEAGARVTASQIRGPAIIGADTVIEHSYIGPFSSIAAGVHIRNSELEHSIVLEHARIWDVPARIEGSLIGKDVLVHRTPALPKVIRLMVGDHSEVGLA